MLLIVARLRARYFREEGGLGCTREVGSVMPFGKMQNPVTFSYVLLGMQFSALMTCLVLYSWFCRLHTGIVKPWNFPCPCLLGKVGGGNHSCTPLCAWTQLVLISPRLFVPCFHWSSKFKMKQNLMFRQLLSPFFSVILCFTFEILTGCVIYTIEGIYPGHTIKSLVNFTVTWRRWPVLSFAKSLLLYYVSRLTSDYWMPREQCLF